MAVKQTIVWRHDLNCRVGKKMAQAGHAALANISNSIRDNITEEGNVSFKLTPEQYQWLIGNFRKIVLRVENEEQLMIIHDKAKELGLTTELIVDSGLTEWDGPIKTCIAIGPHEDDLIDQVTGENGPLGRLKMM